MTKIIETKDIVTRKITVEFEEKELKVVIKLLNASDGKLEMMGLSPEEIALSWDIWNELDEQCCCFL